MAVTRQTLADVLAQKDALKAVGDQRSRELVAAWVRAWDAIAVDLEATIAQMMEEAVTGRPGVSRAVRLRQQRRALRIVSDQLAMLCRAAGVDISADAARLIRLAGTDMDRLIRTQLPDAIAATVTVARVDPGQVEQIVTRTTQQITARTYALQGEAQTAMRRQLSRSLAVGDSPREAARRMVADVKGTFNGGLVRALVIARTEQVDAYRRAAQAQQETNRDLLAGWRWVATLGPRTCPSCLDHHGELHDLDEAGPLDHHQGRCARMPVTKPWSQLGFTGATEPRSVLRDGDGVRWFESQPRAVQEQIMGPRRFEAWQQGSFPRERWSVRKETPDWRPSYHVGQPQRSIPDGS